MSKGPQPVKLRDWTGKDADDAQAWFEAKGLTSEVASEEYSDTVAEGDVISMDPPAGTTVYRGDTVTLVVSKGPELVEVPSVRGVRASTPPPRSSRASASRSRPTTRPATSAWATCSRRPRRRRRWCRRAPTITLSLI